MAQTYKMKHNVQGTIYSLLTVESNGQMTMTFHGTDREICHEVTENADGWLCYPGGMFPGLESGKWNKMDDVRGLTADVVETNTNDTNCTNEVAESETTTDNTDLTDVEPVVVETTTNCTNYTNNEPLTNNRETITNNRETITNNHEPLTVNHQPSSTLKAIGMVAAATVALLVIYETGLLIPLGLIGLATGGILK